MTTAKLFQEFTKYFSESWPPHLGALRSEVDQHVQLCLEYTLTKLNLVTRQEFDVQVELLARTQAKVAQLEQKLAILQAADLETKNSCA